MIKLNYKKIIIIFLFLLFLSNNCLASNYYMEDESYKQDPALYIKMNYDNICQQSLLFIDNASDSEVKSKLIQLMHTEFYYIEMIPDNTTQYKLHIIWADNMPAYKVIYTHISFNDYESIPSNCYDVTTGYQDVSFIIGFDSDINDYNIIETTSSNVYVPTFLYNYKEENLRDYIESFFGGSADQKLIINAIQNNFNKQIEADKENTDSIVDSIDKNTEETKKTNDFLMDDNFDNSSVNLPGDSSEDITANGFNNIFQMFYNAFTSSESKDIIIPIPFANKNITINSRFLYSSLGENSWIVNIMSTFWYFLVGLYVVKDVEKVIEKIKNGDIATSSDTNIKTEML